jgi:uncharacterized protein (DUF2126 family)/transglutaminase-like putative cysteine protease
MRVLIENWMEYAYVKPVSFSPHVIRLYPRTGQSAVTHKLETVVNIANDIQYRRDIFDNLVANCFFPEASERLEVLIKLEVELWPRNPFHFLLANHAVTLPFEYDNGERTILAPFLTIAPAEEAETEQIWRLEGQPKTVPALVNLVEVLHREIEYETRSTGEALAPAALLETRIGACRDTALLCATILRKTGLAARLVSGFLCEFHVDIEDRRAERGLHAWVEVYLPGAGWVGLDPTNGTFCDHRFIATAVGPRPSDIAPVTGSYFGKEHVPGKFDSRLRLNLMTERDLSKIAAHAEQTLLEDKIVLTMGGEPTFIPEKSDGPEWVFAAVGPNKLRFAYEFAERIASQVWPGALVLYTPGKLYPGELDPRWAVNVIRGPFHHLAPTQPVTKIDEKWLRQLREHLVGRLKVEDRWIKGIDPASPKRAVWVLPLDHNGKKWVSEKWDRRRLNLVSAQGPAGLRLPLQLLPEGLTKRALVLEHQPDTLDVFLPPLLAEQMADLIGLITEPIQGQVALRWQGYLPVDLPPDWSRLAFTADPGVLEVNVPACRTWLEYQEWLDRLAQISRPLGLRTIRPGLIEGGTGGGQHVLFGGPTLDENPFFTRPAWLASILRFWQHHPALSYVFTSQYVGSASQAPRADESVPELLNLELAYQQLESLPAGDVRQDIHEILRHLHTDIGGNTHRAEVSFDKFWTAPNGLQGLVEFRALETFPKLEWTRAVTLLFRALLAYLLRQPFPDPLKLWGGELHDRYLLPTALWSDLTAILSELAQWGFGFEAEIFREIWEWRFPVLLETEGLTVRRALEAWPLLAETPLNGGAMSRFVDTSVKRLELSGAPDFRHRYRVFANGRELSFRSLSAHEYAVGLRYRDSNFYPCLHPKSPVQLPLKLVLVERESGDLVQQYCLLADQAQFSKTEGQPFVPGPLAESIFPGAFTADLRLGERIQTAD